MFNRKLLFLLFILTPLKILCSQEQQLLDRYFHDRANHYDAIVRTINYEENHHGYYNYFRNETHDILKKFSSFLGRCGFTFGCYKLLGKILPRSTVAFPYKGAAALFIGSWCWKITSASLDLLSDSTHFGHIFDAMAHRLHPGITQERITQKNNLLRHYQEEAALRPKILAVQQHAHTIIEQLQTQQHELQEQITQEQQAQENEMTRLKHDMENDSQLKSTCDELKKRFEEYVNIIYDIHSNQKSTVNYSSFEILVSKFAQYGNLLLTQKTPLDQDTIQLDKHSLECIERTLELYLDARKNSRYEDPPAYSLFVATIEKIERAAVNSPNKKLQSLLREVKIYLW